MCRWFAYISPTEPALLSDVLINPANAITKQCSEHYLPGLLPHGHEKDLDSATDDLVKLRNSLLNMDGLGVAWYTSSASAYTSRQDGMRPALYKSQSPPFSDFNFRSLCENMESNCLFAHIRASSGSAVTQVNSHPFVFGRHTFMHNGVVSDFTRIRREMTLLMDYDAYKNIQGGTDSEHAAALYMTYLCRHPNTTDNPSQDKDKDKDNEISTKKRWQTPYPLDIMLHALTKTITTILELQKKYLDHPKPNSLNFATTDGERLITCRFRNHKTQQPPSLYWSQTAGRTLNRKYPGNPNDGKTSSSSSLNKDQVYFGADAERIGKHTIVASEPTTCDQVDEWHLIGRNCALVVGVDGVEREIGIVYDGGRLDADE